MPPPATPTRRVFLESAAMAGLGAFWSGLGQRAEAVDPARAGKARGSAT